MSEKIIKTQQLYSLLDWEPFVILTTLIFLAYFFYKVFLRDVSPERHQNLRGHFRNLVRHYLFLVSSFVAFLLISETFAPNSSILRALPYLGIVTYASGLIVLVKISRLITLQYLFLGSMRAGVPVLIVNIFSLVMSIILLLWSLNQIFGIQVGPLIATSAVFSIILGLAMQDTLGNLFAGISLQIDHSFEIDSWLEIQVGLQKVVGQVHEMSWRATTLIGLSDERIILPNRTLANSQISNYSFSKSQTIVRSQTFRIPYTADLNLAKQCLLESIKQVSGIKDYPAPLILISETTESWVSLKLTYFIENYGYQYSIADQVLENGLNFLKANGIEVASNRLYVSHIEKT